jgi:hypothetical protein
MLLKAFRSGKTKLSHPPPRGLGDDGFHPGSIKKADVNAGLFKSR